jgi:hypothetical protein
MRINPKNFTFGLMQRDAIVKGLEMYAAEQTRIARRKKESADRHTNYSTVESLLQESDDCRMNAARAYDLIHIINR